MIQVAEATVKKILSAVAFRTALRRFTKILSMKDWVKVLTLLA